MITSIIVKLSPKVVCVIDYPGDVYGVDGIRLSFYEDDKLKLARRPESSAELQLLLTLHAMQRKS